MPYTQKDRKEHIKEIQKYLRYIAIHNGRNGIIPDGIYSDETKDAVTEFQKNSGIFPTGEIDNETWNRIILEYNLIAPYYEKSVAVSPFRDNFAVIKKGDTGDIVYFIQIILNSIGENSIPVVIIDGFYGDETENAIKKYQSLRGIDPTGETDIFTWNMLAESYYAK